MAAKAAEEAHRLCLDSKTEGGKMRIVQCMHKAVLCLDSKTEGGKIRSLNREIPFKLCLDSKTEGGKIEYSFT